MTNNGISDKNRIHLEVGEKELWFVKVSVEFALQGSVVRWLEAGKGQGKGQGRGKDYAKLLTLIDH